MSAGQSLPVKWEHSNAANLPHRVVEAVTRVHWAGAEERVALGAWAGVAWGSSSPHSPFSIWLSPGAGGPGPTTSLWAVRQGGAGGGRGGAARGSLVRVQRSGVCS